MTRTALSNQLNTLMSQVGTIWNTIKLRANSQASLLLTQNNLLSANLLVTQNEKIVNGIHINMIAQGRGLPNSGEITTLQNIADQCSYIGGRGVLKARGILTLVSEQLQDDDIICGSSIVQPNVTKRSSFSNSIEIYPNPVNDHVQIKWIDNDLVKSGRILNIDGLEVLNFKVSMGNKINIAKLIPGTYILEITDNAKKIIERIVKI